MKKAQKTQGSLARLLLVILGIAFVATTLCSCGDDSVRMAIPVGKNYTVPVNLIRSNYPYRAGDTLVVAVDDVTATWDESADTAHYEGEVQTIPGCCTVVYHKVMLIE